MRVLFGWFMFLVTVIFAAAFVATLIFKAWFSMDFDKGVIGFFGFGIPMAGAALITSGLWGDSGALLKILGWSGGIATLICAACLFVLVGGWVLGSQPVPALGPSAGGFPPRVFYFLWFALPMLGCGLFAGAVLYEADVRR